MFSAIIHDYWRSVFTAGEDVFDNADLSVKINPELDEDEKGALLKVDGKSFISLQPETAALLDLTSIYPLSETVLTQKMAEHGLQLYGADNLFYLATGKAAGFAEPATNVRQLTTDDAAIFDQFCAKASEEDIDAAYVELDHWLVYGAFENNELVCACSMYAWNQSKLADLGVLTLPDFRGKGYARAVVQAICRHAAEAGFEPQYRCQLDNAASVQLAKAAGFKLFGTWDIFVAAPIEEKAT